MVSPVSGRSDVVLQTAIRRVEIVLYVLASAGLVGSIGLAFTAVILRYGFNHSLEWIEEGSRYLALFSALLVAGPVSRNKGHIALDLLTSGLQGVSVEVHRLAMNTVALALSAAASVWGMGLVVQTHQLGLSTASLQFPQWVPYSIVPLGMAVIALFSVFEILAAIQALRAPRSGRSAADGD